MNDSMDPGTLTELLDLASLEVVEGSLDREKKHWRLVVVPLDVAAICPDCGRVSDIRHLCRDREVEDLPIAGRKTVLVVRMQQFDCLHCHRYFTAHHPVLDDSAHATVRLLDRLVELANRSGVTAAAGFLGLAEKTAEHWYYDHLKRLQERPAKNLKPIRSLGIDELSLKKDTASSVAC